MMIIPKVNYITHMLPLSLPAQLLKEYNKCVESFIWQKKKTLFNHIKVYSAKDSGGLSLPRLEWYHYTFSLAQLSKCNLPSHRATVWVEIKKKR